MRDEYLENDNEMSCKYDYGSRSYQFLKEKKTQYRIGHAIIVLGVSLVYEQFLKFYLL